MRDSGAGDMVRRLSQTQERMSYFENLYYQVFYHNVVVQKCYGFSFFQLVNENNSLLEQANSNSLEIERLKEQKQMYYDQLVVQQKEVESLTKSKVSLSEQLNEEKITIVGK